ncbi:hypothetical protein ABSA28_00850 [Candidatus Hepatincolaceae symbiont of Richtersius coronifer]
MKFILTGTHNSGKSTIVEKYKNNPDYNIMGELVRSLSLEPNFLFLPTDKERYGFSEIALLNFYMGTAKAYNILKQKKHWIYDRCIIDPLYYIRYFNVQVPLSYQNKDCTLYAYGISLVTELILDGWFKDAIILLLKPIPIVKDDGFRLQGDTIQSDIFNIAKETLNVLSLPYKEVTVEQAEEIIKNKELL